MIGDELDDFLPQGHRLQILKPEEYELLWGLPRLTATEQDIYFSLTPREQAVFDRVRTARTRIHFMLMLGHFKTRQRFFVIDADVMGDDIAFLADWNVPGLMDTSGLLISF